jgi:hypothetical protein
MKWRPASIAFCAFFSSLYMLVKLPAFAPFFPLGAKEVILLVIVAGCFGYAFTLDMTSGDSRYLLSPAFLACFAAIAFVCGHILFGASRQTVSLSALQLSLFPLLFLFVGGIQTNLRDALTWLSTALVATGVLALAFVFWDAAVGDAYVLKNNREFFAVTASILLVGNDATHEPNTRAQLKEKQPDYYKYLVGVFGFDPEAPAVSPVASAN